MALLFGQPYGQICPYFSERLNALRELANQPGLQVTLIDRNNYHGFWPLLYQVATAGVMPQSIAFSIRALIHSYRNVTFKMCVVKEIKPVEKLVLTDGYDPLPYDYLIVAAGSTTNYFGNSVISQNTYALKDIEQATALRTRLLSVLEQAQQEKEQGKCEKLLTFIIVGAGPSGVELAGAFAELIRPILHEYYPELNTNKVRVLLVEAHDKTLETFGPALQKKAQWHLKRKGVEILPNSQVAQVDEDGLITFKDGRTLEAGTVVWTAGVRASTLAETLGVTLERGGRVPVQPTLNLREHPEIFVIGDMAYLEGYRGRQESYPGVAEVAMQMGKRAARNIYATVQAQPMQPFRYLNLGNMAVLGRGYAVADLPFGIKFSGRLAWLLWLGVHLYTLLGVRNKILVMASWAYNYLSYHHGVRLLGGWRNGHKIVAP